MAKLNSLQDLYTLLDKSERAAPAEVKKGERVGYDGKRQTLTVRLDSKRHRGKTVTLISGFQSNPEDLEETARRLKKSCGAGGQVLDNAIEIQGDHREVVVTHLQMLGYNVK